MTAEPGSNPVVGPSCYFHPSDASAANCPSCGKNLCRNCASRVYQGMCHACQEQVNKALSQEAYAETEKQRNIAKVFGVLAIIALVISFCAASGNKTSSPIGVSLIIGYATWAFLWGVPTVWNILGAISAKLGVVFFVTIGVLGSPIWLGLILFAILAVGAIAAPIRTYKAFTSS
jgi:hypothetical protein